MSKIPCKKCKKCGYYHDLSVAVCETCGSDLIAIPALLIDTESIPSEQFGKIDETITAFVQKCPVCGTLNYTADKTSRVEQCYNCHKRRIKDIAPQSVVVDTQPDDGEDTSKFTLSEKNQSDATRPNKSIKGEVLFSNIKSTDVSSAYDEDDETDEDEDPNANFWAQALEKTRTVIESKGQPAQKTVASEPQPIQAEKMTSDYGDDDDDDDDDEIEWNVPLKDSVETERVHPAKNVITLNAIRYGQYTFSVNAATETPFLLGRDAHHKEFLGKDGRVSNFHCYLLYKNGMWYVKDNHSSNGTAVNARDIGENGESVLHDGDELRLGHHSDSMAFRIKLTT